ncbi:hypothetical protein HPB50_005161 [Hyalomma asiaticum]|uniref:Uncharacterized protein n=1 Tax=Hyalomma asiaticum TaxID=266040 RepID=A0ACB7SCU0_HYAAI|nr:hypothetical protein HPB50_005161 [Hyalomma asiaticum]
MQESLNMDDDIEPFAIRMELLESSPSESICEEFVTAHGSRWSRFRTGIFIATAVVILSIFIAALVVPLREAALAVEGGVELSNSTWLPWRERPNDTGSTADPAVDLACGAARHGSVSVFASHVLPRLTAVHMHCCLERGHQYLITYGETAESMKRHNERLHENAEVAAIDKTKAAPSGHCSGTARASPKLDHFGGLVVEFNILFEKDIVDDS